MSTYQSSQTSAIASSTSTTITKPTSLAVGDLLVAHLFCEDGSSGGSPPSFTVPSGWTQQISIAPSSGGFATPRLQVLTKVADSADVAASNFTFTATGAARTGGGLSRLTNFGKISGSSTATQTNSTTSPISVTGFTPDRTDTLFMVFTCIQGQALGTTPALNTVSLATDNPTWTERYDLNANIAGFAGFAMTTAPRAQDTATGTISVGVGIPNSGNTAIAVIAFAPIVSGSLNATPENIVSNDLVPLSPEGATVRDQPVTTRAVNAPVWTNTDKPTTSTFSNTDKP